MNDAIHVIHEIPVTVQLSNGEIFHTESRFIYNPYDPLAVTLRLFQDDGEHVDWMFARDLLKDMIEEPGISGKGDVQMIYDPEAQQVRMVLSSPEGECGLAFHDIAILSFIAETYEQVGLDHELEISDNDLLKWLSQ